MFDLARTLLIALMTFLAGGVFSIFDLWPIRDMQQIYRYVFDDGRWTRRTPYEVIMSDLGIIPFRHFAPLESSPHPERQYRRVEIDGVSERRDPPLVFVDETRKPALTLIAGLIDAKEALNGVLLLDPAGRVVRQWGVSTEDGASERGEADFPVISQKHAMMHGLELLSDGSIIVAFDGGSSLNRYDACGKLVWSRPMLSHHSVVADGPDHVWTWERQAMVRVEAATGKVVEKYSLLDLAETEPGKYILTTRKYFDSGHGSEFVHDLDPFHGNDIEPLPEEYADAFPLFEAGDLLVSLRAGNLIFVLDRANGSIKWWMRNGSFAQHDPDWQPDGTILLFDNNTDFGASRIIRIDPVTKKYETVLDGEELGFYTDLMGNQDLRADGSILVAVTRQGRAIEYGRDGKVLFEFLNVYDDEKRYMGVVTEARAYPPELLKQLPDCGSSPGAEKDLLVSTPSRDIGNSRHQ